MSDPQHNIDRDRDTCSQSQAHTHTQKYNHKQGKVWMKLACDFET